MFITLHSSEENQKIYSISMLNLKTFFLYVQRHHKLAMTVNSARVLGWFCKDFIKTLIYIFLF